jgi:hypothetical protein
MKKSIKVIPKRRHAGPATGRDPRVTSRLRLVELGLTIWTKSKQGSAARAERAKELASKIIDNLTAATPESDEKASRKGNLIKGPEEFRQVRVDRPKPKKGCCPNLRASFLAFRSLQSAAPPVRDAKLR